jgi:RNA polymerase sigma-70 factor (ECF subfamily)
VPRESFEPIEPVRAQTFRADRQMTIPLELAYRTLPEEEEHESLSALRRGDPRAVAEAYDEHHAAVRAFAQRLLGDPSVAEDLVHDVFVRLPKAISRFRGDSTLRTFLVSIAVNRARHFVRAASRQRAAMERMSHERPAPIEDPEQQVGRRELACALSRALEALPLDQRVAFVLCEVEQRGCAEAGAIMDVPEGTVKSRLFHARRKLREALEREGIR